VKYPSDFERVVGFDEIRTAIISRFKYPSTWALAESWEMETTFEAVVQQLDLLDQIHQLNESTPSALHFSGTDITDHLQHLGIENFYLEEEALSAILATVLAYQKLSTTV